MGLFKEVYDDYQIGVDAWIFGVSDPKVNSLTKGKVVHIFEMYNFKQYIIEIETHVDPLLECRDCLGMRRNGPPEIQKEIDE